ncbi:hypothetical protein Tsubulata_018652 [Turnera subulata]|uniref:DUF3615 domain-containing protein n=1 Tax=Turnera subulata TaxID=218843 RepID=A0A9Q0J1L7_9ROSI|nr:hypothetical protein Tsubulata_018652 [Turnera subulata]
MRVKGRRPAPRPCSPPTPRPYSVHNLKPLNTLEGPEREELRKAAIEILRNHCGAIGDPSRLLKPDDPELKDIEGIYVNRDGRVWKQTPNAGGLCRKLEPEEIAERRQGMSEEYRPHAMLALELYHRQNEGTCFELREVVTTSLRLLLGGFVWHIKFTAKPVNDVGSEAGTSTSTTTTTFYAEVHKTWENPAHASLCFTIDSPIVTGNPDFEILKDGDWIEYPYGCTLCRRKRRKRVKSSSVPSKSETAIEIDAAMGEREPEPAPPRRRLATDTNERGAILTDAVHCRPYALKALELYQRQNEGTYFELVEVVGARFRWIGGTAYHIKFTAATPGSQTGTSTTTTTFLAEVHITRRMGAHASRCFTMDSFISSSDPDPDFKILKNEGDWIHYSWGCTLCEKKRRKPGKPESSVPTNESAKSYPNTRSFAKRSVPSKSEESTQSPSKHAKHQ